MIAYGYIEIVSNETPPRYWVIKCDTQSNKWEVVKQCGWDEKEASRLALQLDNRLDLEGIC